MAKKTSRPDGARLPRSSFDESSSWKGPQSDQKEERATTGHGRRLGNAGHWRLLRVQNLLANEGGLTATKIAQQLETSPRTIKRDIEELRNSYGAEIEWDAARGAYRFMKPGQLPLLLVGADEAMALELAGGMLGAWWGKPLGRAMRSILEKLAAIAGSAITVPLESLQGCLFHAEAPKAGQAQSLISEAAMAVRERRVIRLQYRKPGAEKAEGRVVHPLKVAYLDNEWVLVAYAEDRDALRNFLLHRIEKFEATGRRFEARSEPEIDAYLTGSLGRFSGSAEREVKVAFDELAAPYVLEKPWHPSQRAERGPDGRWWVTMRVNHLTDVQREILAWGRHVEALEPAELRENVAAEVRALSDLYFSEKPKE